ncbi:hypothetical protein P0Y43_13770 [Pseudomonas entomophila]|uniref:RHS repeat-associated core domain-containing protein n=1 Tax=Pseudomonas entomophila TaxID=312306 RepID=UPI0023D7DEE5|nr:RHS repeat-associated core domain-containing protein [Pseudomonas entomophila]MDF0731780.1 hypothetical protein [Pseudomonas entomophila]
MASSETTAVNQVDTVTNTGGEVSTPYLITNLPDGYLPDMSGFTMVRVGSTESGWLSTCPIESSRDLVKGETLTACLVNPLDGELTTLQYTAQDDKLSAADWPKAFAAHIAKNGRSLTAGQWQDGEFTADGDALRLWNHAQYRSFTTAPFARNLVQGLACNDDFELAPEQTLSLQVRDLKTQHLYEQHFFTPTKEHAGKAWSEALCTQVNTNSVLLRAGILDAGCNVVAAAAGNAFWVAQCSELCVTLTESHWWAAREFTATEALTEGEALQVFVYDAFSHRLLDQFSWTPDESQRAKDKWPSAWAGAVNGSSLAQWLHVGAKGTAGSTEVPADSIRATLWQRGDAVRIFTTLPDAENWIPGPRLDEAWANACDAVLLCVRHPYSLKLMHLDVFTPQSAASDVEDQEGWLQAWKTHLSERHWPQLIVGRENAAGQLDLSASATGPVRLWSPRFAELLIEVENVGDGAQWETSRYQDYLLPTDTFPGQRAPSTFVNSFLNMDTRFSRGRACVIVKHLIEGDLEFRLSQAALDKGYSIADCARTAARDGMLGYHAENTVVPVEVSADRVVWRGPIRNSIYEILLDYPAQACDATELVLGYAGLFTEQFFWKGVKSVPFTSPAPLPAYSPSSPLCEDYGNTFRSEVFDVSGQTETGVDPRTGLFHAHYPVATLRGLEGLGPVCDLTLHYSALRGNEAGLGDGWAWRFSSLEHRDRRLTLADGLQIDFTDAEWSELAQGNSLTKAQCVIRSNADYSEVTVSLPSGRQEILTKPSAEGSDEEEPNDKVRQEILRLLRAIKSKSKPEFPAKPQGFQQWALICILPVGYYAAASLDWNSALNAWKDRVKELDQQIAYYERSFVQLLPSRIVSPYGQVLALTWKRQKGQFLLQKVKSDETTLFEGTYLPSTVTLSLWETSDADRAHVRLTLENYLLKTIQRFQGSDDSNLLHEVQYGYDQDPTLDRVLNQVRELDGSVEFVRFEHEAMTFSDSRPALPRVQQHVIIPARNQQSLVSDYRYHGSYLKDEHFACGVTRWIGGTSSADFKVFDRRGRQLAHGDAQAETITVASEALGRSFVTYPVGYWGDTERRVGQRVIAFIRACFLSAPPDPHEWSNGSHRSFNEVEDNYEREHSLSYQDYSLDNDDDHTPDNDDDHTPLQLTELEKENQIHKPVCDALKAHKLSFKVLHEQVIRTLASCIVDPLHQPQILSPASDRSALLASLAAIDWNSFFERYRFILPLLSYIEDSRMDVHSDERSRDRVQFAETGTYLKTLNQACLCNEHDQVIRLKATDGCLTYNAYYSAQGPNTIVCSPVQELPTLECPAIPPGTPAPLMAEYQCDPFGNPMRLTLYGYRACKRNDRDLLEVAHTVTIEGVKATLSGGQLDANATWCLSVPDKAPVVRRSSTTVSAIANKTKEPDCKVKVWSTTEEQTTQCGNDVFTVTTSQAFENNPNGAGIEVRTSAKTTSGTVLLKKEVRSRFTHKCLQKLEDHVECRWRYDALARVVEHQRYLLQAGATTVKKDQKPDQTTTITYSTDSKVETHTLRNGEQTRNHKDGLQRVWLTQWRRSEKASFVPMTEQSFASIDSSQLLWGLSWDYLPGGQAVLANGDEVLGEMPWSRQVEGEDTLVEHGLGRRLLARHRQRTEPLSAGGFIRSDSQTDAQGNACALIKRRYDGNGALISLERTVDGKASNTTLVRDQLGRVTHMTRADGSVIERSYKGFSNQVIELKVDAKVVATQEVNLPSTLTSRTVGTRRYGFSDSGVALPDKTLLSFSDSAQGSSYKADEQTLAQLTLSGAMVKWATPDTVDSEGRAVSGWAHCVTGASLPGASGVEESGPRGTVKGARWQSLRGVTVAARGTNGHLQRCFDDRAGRTLRTCQEHEDARFRYDALGHLVSRHVHALGGGGQWQVCSQHDAFDQETCRTFSRNDSVVFEQRLTWKGEGKLGSKQSCKGRQVLRTERFDYDELDRLKAYSCEALAPEHYPQDATNKAVKSQTFIWDSLSNMTECLTTYSDHGTRKQVFGYEDNDPTRLKSVKCGEDAKVLSWSSNGWLTTDEQGRTLSYNAGGQLTQICDAQNQVLSRYTYDGHDRLAAQYVATDATTRELRYSGSELIGEVWFDKDGNASRSISLSRGLAAYEGASVRWLIDDPQSGVVGEVNGTTLTMSPLLPFGEGADACALDMGYNGMRRDPVTGNYHAGNGYRCYNPTLGRYLQPDWLSPFGQGGINDYVHCPDPVNWHDPSGAIMLSRWAQAQTLNALEQHLSEVQPMPVGTKWRGLAMSAVLTVLGIASVVMSGGATSAWVVAALTTLNTVSFGLEFASEMVRDVNPGLASKLGIASGITGVLSIGNPAGMFKLLAKGFRACTVFALRIARGAALQMHHAREAFRIMRLRGIEMGRIAWNSGKHVPKALAHNSGLDILGSPHLRGFTVARRPNGKMGRYIGNDSPIGSISEFIFDHRFEIIRGWKADLVRLNRTLANLGEAAYQTMDLYLDFDDLKDGLNLFMPEEQQLGNGSSLKGRLAKLKVNIPYGRRAEMQVLTPPIAGTGPAFG